MGIIHQKNNIGVPAYQMEHLNPELTWVIASDIVAIKKFDNNRSLVVIPYVALREKNIDSDTFIADGYDFIFVWIEIINRNGKSSFIPQRMHLVD